MASQLVDGRYEPPMATAISSNPPAELDEALRVDVRVLGDLLGEVLEHSRRGRMSTRRSSASASKARCYGNHMPSDRDPALEELYAIVEALPTENVGEVVRAFSLFLTLANTAEQRHKVRERRTAQMRAARGHSVEPRLDSYSDTIARMIAAGIDPDRVHEAASTQHVEFVLTAHPTQVIRRTLLQRYNRMTDALRSGDRKDLTPDEQHAVRSQLRREISTVWHTDELHQKPPHPHRRGARRARGPRTIAVARAARSSCGVSTMRSSRKRGAACPSTRARFASAPGSAETATGTRTSRRR